LDGPRVEYWFEFGSTYSHISSYRIGSIARDRGISIAWRPFLLGPIFREQGWNDSPFNLYPAKGEYMWRDMERCCARLGVPFRRPSHFPRDGLLAARIALVLERTPEIEAFVKSVFLANFHEDLDIASPELMETLLEGAGVSDSASMIDEALAPENKSRLRERTAAGSDRGIFGAPSFVVKDELFWGNDRLEDALDWADP
jgi:2-hydroxychromene-2-carboxylate isomerase